MKSIIDLGSELLFDLTAIGQELARASPWVSVNKRMLAVYDSSVELIATDLEQRLVA